MLDTLSPSDRARTALPPDEVERFALALEAVGESVYEWNLLAGSFDHLSLTDTTMKRTQAGPPVAWIWAGVALLAVLLISVLFWVVTIRPD